ncbi:MAG TPA: hypothetical protein VMY18_09055, partial [Acidobacteriota bacterium]|nr:hypothetical protein [Acidobacteriota bacterium]
MRLRLILILTIALLAVTCSHKRPVLNIPATQTPLPTPDEYIVQGDTQFSKMHLYGWREAEAFYECAFEVEEDPSTLAKLILTRFLMLIRESEEGIFGDTYLEDLNFICQNANEPFQLTLCEIARNRLTLEGILEEAPLLDLSPAVSRKLLDERKRNSALDGYLFLLFLQDMAPYRMFDESELFKQEYPESPLADYLHSAQGNAGTPLKVVADPEFAELERYAGERLIDRERYQ